ncbi:MAG TPA: DUF3459 domain-containing protein [Thermoanaerobaculia bacterium]|nr:DUF3459 domain-containing protein [Thermoanaerobaculia bacterium]
MRAQDPPPPARRARRGPLTAVALALFFAGSAGHAGHAAPPAPPAAVNPDWAPGAVLYEIAVPKGGLQGLIAKLDYLNDGNPHSFGDLGVDVLYLRRVGAGEDLAPLLAGARKRGMKVIVDPGRPGGGSLPKSLDAPLAAAVVKGAKEGQAGGIAAQLAELVRRSPGGKGETPFLASPAGPRLAAQLGDLGREKSAAAVLLTLPGAPFLSDGEELGMGEKANVAAETSDPDSLLSSYRFLIRARHNSEALRQGSLTLLTQATETTPVLAFRRATAAETVLVVHNLGDAAVEAGPYNVSGTPDPFYLSPGVTPPTGGAGAWKVKLPPHASGIWRLRVR